MTLGGTFKLKSLHIWFLTLIIQQQTMAFVLNEADFILVIQAIKQNPKLSFR
jgi:hypothetical protein